MASEDPRAGELLRVLHQARAQASRRVQLVRDKLVEDTYPAIRANQGGVLDVAIQPQAVSAAPGDGDTLVALSLIV